MGMKVGTPPCVTHILPHEHREVIAACSHELSPHVSSAARSQQPVCPGVSPACMRCPGVSLASPLCPPAAPRGFPSFPFP